MRVLTGGLRLKKRYLALIFFQCVFVLAFFGCGGGGGGSHNASGPVLPDVSTWRVIAVGNSITWGYNYDNPHEEGYVPKLSRMLGINVVNLGVPGVRTQYIADHIVSYLKQYKPTHVLLLIGANDVTADPYDVDHYIRLLQYIVNTIRAYHAIPVVGTIIHFCHFWGRTKYNKNIDDKNAAIRTVIGQQMHVTIADFAPHFNCDLMESTKGMHPSDEGYQLMAQIWYDTLMTDPKY